MRKKALKHQSIYFWKEKNDSGSSLYLSAQHTHTKHTLKTNQFHIFFFSVVYLVIIILMLFRSWMFFFPLHVFFSFVVHHLAVGKVTRDSSYSSETTPNMFLWSAYMNNEKTFVIEILVLRVFIVRDLCDSSTNYSVFDSLLCRQLFSTLELCYYCIHYCICNKYSHQEFHLETIISV